MRASNWGVLFSFINKEIQMQPTNNYDNQKNLRASAKQASIKIGKERQAEKDRKCPVPNCKHEPPKYFSRYCTYHAYKLRRNGHPTLNLNIRSPEDYANCVKLGRWLRAQLTADDADRRAWGRIEDSLIMLGRKQEIDFPMPIIAKRRKNWTLEFTALVVLSRQLKVKPVEEILAGYLGMVVLILEGNELLLTSKQLELCLCKAGARSITRFGQWKVLDEDGKTYRYHPSAGCMSKIGAVVFKAIAHEFSMKWYKLAEEKIAMLERPPQAEGKG